MSNFPKGWITAKLEEITKMPKSDIVDGPFGSNLKADEYKSKGIPLIRLQNIDRNQFLDKNTRFIDSEKAELLKRHSFVKGDIVVTKLGVPVGKACIVPNHIERGIIVADVVRVRVDEENVSKKFVVFAINSPTVITQINSFVKGSTRPRVNLSHIRSLEIPLPPLNEQKRIVAKLEALLSRVDASKERLEKIPKILKRFRQSVLAAACSGKLTADWRAETANGEDGEDLPFGWERLLSENAFEFVTSGSRGWAKYYSESGALFIRVGNLNHDSIELDFTKKQFVNPPSNSEGVRTKVQLGDILVSITADVGMIGLVESDIGEAFVNQHVALARPKNDINKRFLALFLASENGQKQFRDLQRGATKAGLGLSDIKSVWLLIPSPEEQKEIVRRVEDLFKFADSIEERFKQAKAQVDKLTNSILAKAFRGELVPQDEADEPASVLLERIKAEKEKMQKPARSKGAF